VSETLVGARSLVKDFLLTTEIFTSPPFVITSAGSSQAALKRRDPPSSNTRMSKNAAAGYSATWR
jgi:hypothetical protein